MAKDSPLGRVTSIVFLRHFGMVKLKMDLPRDIVVLSDVELFVDELVPVDVENDVELLVDWFVPEEDELDVPSEKDSEVAMLVD
jgi:hypothetical protein